MTPSELRAWEQARDDAAKVCDERAQAARVQVARCEATKEFSEAEFWRERVREAIGCAERVRAIPPPPVEEAREPAVDRRCDHTGIGLPGCVICDPRTDPRRLRREMLQDMEAERTGGVVTEPSRPAPPPRASTGGGTTGEHKRAWDALVLLHYTLDCCPDPDHSYGDCTLGGTIHLADGCKGCEWNERCDRVLEETDPDTIAYAAPAPESEHGPCPLCSSHHAAGHPGEDKERK